MRNIFTNATRVTLAAGMFMVFTVPAFAQDAFNSAGDAGQFGQSSGQFIDSQTGMLGGSGGAPMLQGVSNATIAPQGNDATAVQGINTGGIVRVNPPWRAWMGRNRALLGLICAGAQILCLAFGGLALYRSIKNLGINNHKAVKFFILGLALGIAGVEGIPLIFSVFLSVVRGSSSLFDDPVLWMIIR